MFRIFPSLLDKCTDLLRSADTWEKYWGSSETPKKSLEEFEREQLTSFIDSINRVPFDSEAADKGTAFNELVDCLILGTPASDKMDIASEGDLYRCTLHSSGREFCFDKQLAARMYHRYREAQPQVLVEAPMRVAGEDVLLYGYIDELMPFAIHDIKTTKSWELNKFRDHAQHLVYTYCVRYLGSDCDQFYYDIVQWGKEPGKEEFNVESYMWTHESYGQLYDKVATCIALLKQYRPLICDKRVFGGTNNPNINPIALEKWLTAPSPEAKELYKELFNIDLILET